MGSILDVKFGWQANFKFIFALSLIALLCTSCFVVEPFDKQATRSLCFKKVLHDYLLIITDIKFLMLSIIPSLMYAGLIVYIFFNSVLFVNHLGVSKERYGCYQSCVMGSFFIFSMLSVKLIKRYGSTKVQFYGTLIALFGSITMVIVTQIFAKSTLAITLSTSFCVSGIATAIGTYVVSAISHIPRLKGTSAALLGTIKAYNDLFMFRSN